MEHVPSQDEILAGIPVDLNVTMELVDKHVKEGRGNKIAYY
ncbi:MAG: hypothetical protein ACP5GY_06305 [Vulcanisaeta sp.]